MRNRAGAVVLGGGLIVFGVAVAVVLATTGGQLRYTADHTGTVALWQRWVPALAGIVLIRLLPSPPSGPVVRADRRTWTDALVLLAAAVAFAAGLILAGGGEPAHTLLKIPLLLILPLVLLHGRVRAIDGEPWRSWVPVVPVLVWLALHLAVMPAGTGLADPVTLLVTLVIVFAVNALLEEVFYRRWLQTRWETLLGRWPAIVLATLVWSVWHAAIQGGGSLPHDLAAVIAGHAVTGVFLGYLWSAYRRMWPILTVHGLINAAPLLIASV